MFSLADRTLFHPFAMKMLNYSNAKSDVRTNNINHRAAWQKDTFAYCFRPIHIVSRAFGLMPFSITFDSNGEIQKSNVSKFDVLWFVVWLCLLLFGICFSLKMANEHHLDSKTLSLITVLGDTGKKNKKKIGVACYYTHEYCIFFDRNFSDGFNWQFTCNHLRHV